MYGSQIERLKRDSKELKHYIQKIERTGNSQLVYKLQMNTQNTASLTTSTKNLLDGTDRQAIISHYEIHTCTVKHSTFYVLAPKKTVYKLNQT
jgi:hypothetical protein